MTRLAISAKKSDTLTAPPRHHIMCLYRHSPTHSLRTRTHTSWHIMRLCRRQLGQSCRKGSRHSCHLRRLACRMVGRQHTGNQGEHTVRVFVRERGGCEGCGKEGRRGERVRWRDRWEQCTAARLPRRHHHEMQIRRDAKKTLSPPPFFWNSRISSRAFSNCSQNVCTWPKNSAALKFLMSSPKYFAGVGG